MDDQELNINEYIITNMIDIVDKNMQYTVDELIEEKTNEIKTKALLTPAYCRLCADNNDIISPAISLNENEDIFIILNQLSIINPDNDGDTNYRICLLCLNFLNRIIDFKANCLAAQKKFEEILHAKQTTENILDLEFISIKKDNVVISIVEEIKEQDMAVPSKKNVVESRKREVNGKFEWICLDCEDVFSSCAKLKKHRQTCEFIGNEKSRRTGPFACEICGQMIPTLTGLRVHKHKHIRNLGFGSKEEKNELKNKAKSKICHICGKVCNHIGALKSHIMFHNKEKNIECQICNKKFFHMFNLKDHLNMHAEVRNYSCSQCNKKFYTKNVLRKHEKIHDGELKKSLCPMCPKKFTHPYQLRTHLMIHTGDKPHYCKLCDSKFRFSWDLRKHIEKLHNSCEEVIFENHLDNEFLETQNVIEDQSQKAQFDEKFVDEMENIEKNTVDEVFYDFMEC